MATRATALFLLLFVTCQSGGRTTTTWPTTGTSTCPTTTTITTPGNITCPTTTATTYAEPSTTVATTTRVPACNSDPCSNNANCENIVDDFRCICLPSWKEGVVEKTYVGKTCDQVREDVTTPEIFGIEPLFGPIAGGTNLTVTGQYFNIFIPYKIYIGRLTSGVNRNVMSISDKTAYFMSPLATDSDAGSNLTIRVEFSTGVTLPSSLHFVYKGNPNITDIYPLEHITSGGTSLTVQGANLDAVAVPYLEITQVYTFLYDAGPPPVLKTNTTLYLSRCSLNTSESLHCLLPSLSIPDEFVGATDNVIQRSRRFAVFKLPDDVVSEVNTTPDGDVSITASEGESPYKTPRARTKRQSPGKSGQIPFKKGNSTLEFFVGFRLDGYDKFDNLSESLPEKEFAFFPPPSFVTAGGVLEFDPSKNATLSIEGKGMRSGSTEADYNVSIGRSLCEVKELLDNRLICAPPVDKPDYHDRDGFNCDSHLFSLTVYVGYSENHVGCIKYVDQSTTVYIIIGVSVAAFVLIDVVIVIAVCCWRRKKSKKAVRAGKGKTQDEYLTNKGDKGRVKNDYGRAATNYKYEQSLDDMYDDDDDVKGRRRPNSGYTEPSMETFHLGQ